MERITVLGLGIICILSFPGFSADAANSGGGAPAFYDSVVVTATRHEVPLKNVPARIEVISRQELQQVSSRRPSDALGIVSGVDIEGGTGMGIPEKKTVSLDGMPAYYTLLLVDGTPILSSHFHTGADLDLIPSENIERIEILKGPGSARYGSSAVAGVVNLITKGGLAVPILNFETRAGTHNTYASSLSIRGSVDDNVLFNTHASWEQSDGTGLIEPEQRLHQLNYKNLTIGNKVDFKAGCDSVEASVDYTDIASTFAHNPATSRLFIPAINVRHPLSDNALLEVAGAYTRWEYQGIAQDLDKSVIFYPELNAVASPHLMLHYSGFKNHAMAAGADYNYGTFERTAVPRHDQHRGGLFVEDHAQLSDKLWLDGAARLDVVRNTTDSVLNPSPVLSPSLGALYRPSDLLGFRLAVGRSFRTPSLQELYQSRLGHEDAVINGNPKLKPEYSSTVNGNVEINPTTSFSITLGGSATWLSDMILYVKLDSTHDTAVFDPVVGDMPTVPVFNRENVAKAFVAEGDISVKWQIRPMTFQAGYSYTYNQDRTNRRILNYYPGAGVNAKIAGAWNAGPRFRLEPFAAMKSGIGRKIWSLGMESGETNGEESLSDFIDLSAGLNLSFMNAYTFFIKASNLLGQQIENYEDVLMKTNGDRLIEAGIRLTLL